MPIRKVFLSYNRQDQAAAHRLYEQLAKHDIEAWIDVEHPDPRKRWPESVASAIRESDSFIALLGPHGVGEEQKEEINYARQRRKRSNIGLIFVRIPGYKETEDPFLEFLDSNFTYQDFSRGLGSKAVHAIASIIKQDIVPPPAPPPVVSNRKNDARILTFSGGTGAGTGFLCERLEHRLVKTFGKDSCRVLSMERYYTVSKDTRSKVFTNTFGSADFDNPKIIDFAQMVHDLQQLQRGAPIEVQRYNLEKHAPEDFETIMPPSHFVLLEGVYLLQNPLIREMSAATIYLDVDPQLRFARRIWKDVTGLKMDLHDVLSYYCRVIRPAFQEWVHPHQRKANLSLRVDARDHIELDAKLDSAAHRLTTFLRRTRLLAREKVFPRELSIM
jgi:uridine kinase